MNRRALHGRRWHDNRGELSKMVDVLENLPEELYGTVVEGINERAENRWGVKDALKSLGTEKVLALHKSKNKSRRYDQRPALHKAVTYLMVLPPRSQDELAADGLRFIQSVVEYLSNCKTYHILPSSDDLQKMREIFVKQGPQPVAEFIQGRYPQFLLRVDVMAEESGMRITNTTTESSNG